MTAVRRGDTGYPASLLALSRPPERLYLRGEPGLGPFISVVGTRGPDREGRRFAREVGAALARAGITVVSGGALGVDAAAHQGALEAGGRTVAVLGTGVDVAYPAEHRALFERIAEAGALASEHPPGPPPRRAHFPQRNRIVAALGAATVVVQAGHRSGALSTAAYASSLGRPIVAIPWSPYEPRGEGTARLIRAGASFAGSIGDVMRSLGLGGPCTRSPARARGRVVQPSLAGRAVLSALDQGPLYLAEIVDETSLAPEDVVREILTLTLEGLVEEVGFQRFGHAGPPRNG